MSNVDRFPITEDTAPRSSLGARLARRGPAGSCLAKPMQDYKTHQSAGTHVLSVWHLEYRRNTGDRAGTMAERPAFVPNASPVSMIILPNGARATRSRDAAEVVVHEERDREITGL